MYIATFMCIVHASSVQAVKNLMGTCKSVNVFFEYSLNKRTVRTRMLHSGNVKTASRECVLTVHQTATCQSL